MKQVYRGRFAPSPTGPLHFGSLVAAAASYLDARSKGGVWIVRIEDLDRDREQAGAAESILADLERFGFERDGPVMRQSQRTEAYREAFERLQAAGFVYPCACSRKEIADSAARTGDATGQRYPGTCAEGLLPGKRPRSWRVRAGREPICFEDRLHGRQCQNVADAVGDFVLLRADGSFAYQLAVVVDDDAQGITDVVRGADLLDSTPRQIHLQQLLGITPPRYLHIPVATDAAGNKLSKQTQALALDTRNAGGLICTTLRFLGQQPPAHLHGAPIGEVWRWAVNRWSANHLPAVVALPAASAGNRLMPEPPHEDKEQRLE